MLKRNENLESMALEHYKVMVEPDGTRYIQQNIDKLDKNRRKHTTELANEAKIYALPGNPKFSFIYKFQQNFQYSTTNK